MLEAIADRGYSEQIKSELDKWEKRCDEIRAELATKPNRLDSLPDVIPKALARYRDKVLNLARVGDSPRLREPPSRGAHGPE